LFTQDYHLKRAMYIAKRLGIKTQWMSSDLQEYRDMDYFERRELFSRIKAFLEVEILKSKPKFLGESIEIK
jgi:vancomycin permeability regulator SanA